MASQEYKYLAAMFISGILAVVTERESEFFDYVRGSPFDGKNPNFIAVLDNCSVHHVRQVTELFKNAGILVIFLPFYSPDIMPIEKTFSCVKHYLK